MKDNDEFHIPEIGHQILNDPVKLQKQIKSGKSFQEIIGYSEKTMHKFYSAACRLFEKQKYEESSDAFIFLTTLNPFVHQYWLGLGMSEHMLEEYSAALIAYNMAIATNKTNPIPYYHAAACHKALYDNENACILLNQVLKIAGEQATHAQIKQQAFAALHLLLRP